MFAAAALDSPNSWLTKAADTQPHARHDTCAVALQHMVLICACVAWCAEASDSPNSGLSKAPSPYSLVAYPGQLRDPRI